MTSNERHELFINADSDYAIFFCDREMRIVEWNRSAERILGYAANEVIGRTMDFLFTAEDRAAGAPEKEVHEATVKGEAADERWHLKKGGGPIFAQGRLIALRRTDGSLGGFAKVLRDWTAQKDAQASLQSSEMKFRSFFELSGAGNVQVDPESDRIVAANRKFCEMLGYTPEEVVRTCFIDTIYPEERAAYLGHRAKVAVGEHEPVERRYLRKNGTVLWGHSCMTFIPTKGESRQLFIVVQDISLLKDVEQSMERRVSERTSQLEDKTRHMEELCYTVAHDLRAPLRAIGGYAKVILEDHAAELSKEVHDYAGRICGSAQKLERLIQDLLSYTRIEQSVVVHEAVSLDEVVAFAVQNLEEKFRSKRAQLKVAPDLGKVVGDRAIIEHVLLNLLSNAAKFSKRGVPPRISVYSKVNTDTVELSIEDNGIGVPEQYRERIFGIFERLNPGHGYSGTGVGLAIVAKGVNRLGGAVGVSDGSEGGSRFWIRLRRHKGAM